MISKFNVFERQLDELMSEQDDQKALIHAGLTRHDQFTSIIVLSFEVSNKLFDKSSCVFIAPTKQLMSCC